MDEKDRFPMPSEDEALELLNGKSSISTSSIPVDNEGYFNGSFNTLYPLFDEYQIRNHFTHSYPPDHETNTTW
jgi:hypothetical protein